MHRIPEHRRTLLCLLFLGVFAFLLPRHAMATTVQEVRERGVLRHLGIPYANFVTSRNTGFDVDLIRLFAQYLGVEYEFVQTDWTTMIRDLTGTAAAGGNRPPRGDLLASGITMMPPRTELMLFSAPTFPTQVWLITRADSPLAPITPSNSAEEDIRNVRSQLKGVSVMGMRQTCTDPGRFNLPAAGATIRYKNKNLNMLAPSLLRHEADAILLDVPDALLALNKWPGNLKVIGPVSEEQRMGVGFAPESASLREAFNAFLRQCQEDGTYMVLVKKYYANAMVCFKHYFRNPSHAPAQ